MAWPVARRRGDFPNQFYRTLWSSTGSGVSVGACGGSGSSDVGSLAAPEMAVLGDAAAGGVHVRIDNLGTLSLCGGHFWRHGHRDAWLWGRRLVVEIARR